MKLADKCHENVFYGIILCCCNKCYCDRGNIILFSGKLDCFYTTTNNNNNDCFGVSHLLEGYNIWKEGLFFNKRRVYGIGTTYLLWMGIERKLYRKKPISYRNLDVQCPSKTNIYLHTSFSKRQRRARSGTALFWGQAQESLNANWNEAINLSWLFSARGLKSVYKMH